MLLIASWGLWGRVLGPLGLLLGPFGRVLGASWGDVGSLLERSWGLLGRSYGLCCHKLIFRKIGVDLKSILRSQKGPQRGSKWSSTWSRIEVEIEDNTCSSLGPSSNRFWNVLVKILGSRNIKIHLFLQCLVKIHVFQSDKVWKSILD